MQDIDIIERQNARAVEEHSIKTRDAGKFGLAKYTGLNFHSWADFDSEAERNQAAIEWNNASPGNRVSHFNPSN